MLVFLLIVASISVYLFITIISTCHMKRKDKKRETDKDKDKEHFLSCVNEGGINYLPEYPYIDNQKLWYAEFPNSVFISALSKKQFVIKKDINDPNADKQLTQYIEDWLNSIKSLNKPNSRLSVKSLLKISPDTIQYDMIIHRNGRNHGKVMKLDIKEESDQIIINNIIIVGVKTEYEILDDAIFNHVGRVQLKYRFEDMWEVTNDEKILQNEVEESI